MSTLRPKNWAEFQHYKDRSPAWIKLHRGILDDFDYSCLPIASKALAPLLWLLASEHKDGDFSSDPARIAHRLRWSVDEVVAGLKPLIEKGFFVLASGVLAECYQDACLEERRGEDIKQRGEKNTVRPTASRFDQFWTVYPNKKGRQEAEKRWRKDKLDAIADQIIAHVLLMTERDDSWGRGFAPMGSTYLNQSRWTDVPQAAPQERKAGPGKRMQAILTLEAMKNGTVDSGRDSGRLPEARLLGFGQDAASGADARNGNGVDGGDYVQPWVSRVGGSD